MKSLKRFRAFVALLLATLVCLVSAHAVDLRMVGSDTKFVYNGVTYTFRAHINSSSNGAIYGGASAKSSMPLQGGNMGVLAYVYDYAGEVVQTSNIIYNPNNNSTVLSTTDYITAPGTYFCGAMIVVYDASTGDYIRRYADSDAGPLVISTSSASIPASKSCDTLKRRNKEWLDQVKLEREAEIAEKAKQTIERIFPSDDIGDLIQRERKRMSNEKAEIETEIAEAVHKSLEQLSSDTLEDNAVSY